MTGDKRRHQADVHGTAWGRYREAAVEALTWSDPILVRVILAQPEASVRRNVARQDWVVAVVMARRDDESAPDTAARLAGYQRSLA